MIKYVWNKNKNVIGKNSAFNKVFTQYKLFDTSLIINMDTARNEEHCLK